MLKKGDTYELKTSFTQEDVNTFARITGDTNPIHIDPAFAATTLFGRPIVHGYLAGAVFSRVFGTLMLPQGSIYMSQTMKFVGPVFVDTPYVAKFEVLEVDTERHNGIISCRLVDEETNKDVIVGEAKLKNNQAFV